MSERKPEFKKERKNEQKKMSNMKCSICANEIDEKYCSKCGQYHKAERITFITILKDLFGSIFSLEKSFFNNIKIGLLQPKTLVTNYWNGFRNYYFSPGKFLVIASIFFTLQIALFNDFFSVRVSSIVASQFTLLILIIFFLTISSFIIYLKYKRSFYEHLILSIYNVSLWSIIFVPISMVLNLFNVNKTVEVGSLFVYLVFIIIWNSKIFEMNKHKRFIYVILNLILLIGTISALTYFTGNYKLK